MTRAPLALTVIFLLLTAGPLRAQRAGGPAIGVNKIWTGAVPHVEMRLDIAEALAADVIEVATTPSGITGAPREIERATAITDAAAARGIRVFLAVGGRVGARSLEDIRTGGAAWGRWAASRLDDVIGFGVFNEVNLSAQRLERREGEAAAEEIIQKQAARIVAFAEGVHSECPRCKVIPGGIGGREIDQDFEHAVRFMEVLAPHVRSGLIDGLDTHWYRGRSAFRPSGGRSGNGRAMWKEDPTAIIDDLLERAGWPLDTDLYMTEVNVRQSTFRNPEEAGAALEAMLSALAEDPRTRAILVFTPYYNENRQTDVARNYVIRPGTPVGEAVREVSARFDGGSGGPGGVPGAEAPWYCRWFGIGCD